MLACHHPSSTGFDDDPVYLTSRRPTTLFSVNDGELATLFPAAGPVSSVEDSITRIRLHPDRPPDSITVYGTTSSTIYGSPYATIIGRYGMVTNHGERPGLPETSLESAGTSEISVVDLESADLRVVSRIELDVAPRLALAHPDGARLIVASSDQWLVFRVETDGELVELSRSPSVGSLSSFDIGPDGRTIVAAVEPDPDSLASRGELLHFELGEGNRIQLRGEVESPGGAVDAPFSPRISPDGKRALVLNGGGMPDGVLDDVLVLDLSGEPRVARIIPQVADGLESLAFQPSGELAVVACVNAHGPTVSGQIAVIDLSASNGSAERLLYHLPIERVPEGIEFSSDGRMLFVGVTLANAIVVYRVEGKKLIRRPQLLATGYGPSALAIVEP